jgi:hypothetical protein
MEVRHLCEADAHLAKAEAVTPRQLALIAKLTDAGRDTVKASSQLLMFEGVLTLMREDRATIVKTIEQIDAGLVYVWKSFEETHRRRTSRKRLTVAALSSLTPEVQRRGLSYQRVTPRRDP